MRVAFLSAPLGRFFLRWLALLSMTILRVFQKGGMTTSSLELAQLEVCSPIDYLLHHTMWCSES